MGDLALVWDAALGCADLAVVDDDLASDDGLRTSLLPSLFLDRRAEADDDLPAADGDRRGWWADQFAEVEGDRIGSRRWLLDRSKRTADVVRRAEEIDREALAWLIDDRVTAQIDIAVTAEGGALIHSITVHRPAGDPASFRFPEAWDGEAAR